MQAQGVASEQAQEQHLLNIRCLCSLVRLELMCVSIDGNQIEICM